MTEALEVAAESRLPDLEVGLEKTSHVTGEAARSGIAARVGFGMASDMAPVAGSAR